MNMKAIFFDMDGVLFFTEPLHFTAWQHCIISENKAVPDFFNLEYILGLSDISLAGALKNHCKINCSIQEMCRKKEQIFIEMLENYDLQAPAGRDVFLLSCKNQSIVMGVVSSSTKNEIEELLNKAKIRDFFQFTVSSRDTEKHKPNPEPYLLATEKGTVSASNAVVIEDSIAGIKSALDAGLKVYAMNAVFDNEFAGNPNVENVSNFNEVRLN